MKKIFISGCFDLLHTGHMTFFEEVSSYGELYVAIGSDQTVTDLKGRSPINSEQERLYAIQSNKYIHNAFIASGNGVLDFEKELKEIQPDIFITNEDGNYKEKENLCNELDVEYIVLKREPHEHLPKRSTTQLRTRSNMPFRIDLAGGWLDQAECSSLYPGPVITISVEPTIEFNNRSGMASSTRKAAIDLWQQDIPSGDFEKNAKIAFCYENFPGSQYISGSQDAIGLVMPGLKKANYDGKYWPSSIESIHDDSVLDFIENSLYLIPLNPRIKSFNVLKDSNINRDDCCSLSISAKKCWKAINQKDINMFGMFLDKSRYYQMKMFPSMINKDIEKSIAPLLSQNGVRREGIKGWKISGAGAGGYIILVSDVNIPHSIRIKIRRKQHYSII